MHFITLQHFIGEIFGIPENVPRFLKNVFHIPERQLGLASLHTVFSHMMNPFVNNVIVLPDWQKIKPDTPGPIAQSVASPAWPHTFMDIDHEIFSTVILLPLIQEELLSVTSESMCTEYWLTP